jgi:uncharacterized membrane protein
VSETRRSFSGWLALSLVLNLILTGFIGGFLLRPHHERFDGRPGGAGNKDAQFVRQLLMEQRTGHDAERQAHRAAVKALGEALRKEPFDADAVQTRFANLRSADAALKQAQHSALIEKLATLTPDERARVANVLGRERARQPRSP